MALPILRPWKVYELKIRKKSYKSLRRQFSYLKKNVEVLYSKPTIRIWAQTKELQNLNEFFTDMWIYSLEDEIYGDVKSAMISWYRGRSRVNKEDLENFWVNFNKNNPAINDYMDQRSKLQLSDYKWSIARTTKNTIIKLLQAWFKDWKSYTQIASDINKLDSKLFSMDRAKMIATNETWKAFEYWNNLPIFEIVQKWWKAKKKWNTMHDGRVTPTHLENEKLWWVDFNFVYTATWWDQFPPASDNPRCRCNETYIIE